MGVGRKVCLKYEFSKTFTLKYSLFLRSYSRLQFIPSIFKTPANLALVSDLRLYTSPQLEGDHTANILISFPSEQDPQVEKIRAAPLTALP